MSINKIPSSFAQNPQSNDLSYSEKVDKNQYENTDNEQNSSIKFGISKEELEAFSNGTNLEIFEKKDLKFKAKKLFAYVKNGEIKCQIKVRNLVFGLSTLIFCLLLFILASNSFARSQTILNGPQSKVQEIQTILKVESKLQKNEQNVVAAIEKAGGPAQIKKEQAETVKQVLNVETNEKNEKVNQIIVVQKQIPKQESKQKKQSNLKSEQPKDLQSKTQVKQSKANQEKKITVTDVPKSNQQQNKKVQQKINLPTQNVKDNKESIAPVKVENKKLQEPLNTNKNELTPVEKPKQKKNGNKNKKAAEK